MKTSLSPAQQQVMGMFESGLNCRQIAEARGETMTAIYRKRTQALYKRRIASGATPAPITLKAREDAETAEDTRIRIVLDIAFDLRCPQCHVWLSGSDCADAGACVARSPDLLRSDSMDRIARLWTAVELGRNKRE